MVKKYAVLITIKVDDYKNRDCDRMEYDEKIKGFDSKEEANKYIAKQINENLYNYDRWHEVEKFKKKLSKYVDFVMDKDYEMTSLKFKNYDDNTIKSVSNILFRGNYVDYVIYHEAYEYDVKSIKCKHCKKEIMR